MESNDIIGTVGVGLILAGYFLNLNNLIKKEGKLFFSLNIVGSLLAALASYLIHYWPFVVLEASWCLISIAGLVRITAKQDSVRDN